MTHKPPYMHIDVEQLLILGGNSTYADGVLLFDNLGENPDDMMSKHFLERLLIKTKLDIFVVGVDGELNYMLDSGLPVCLKRGNLAYFRQDQIVEILENRATAKIFMIAFPHEMTIGIPEIDTEGVGLRSVLFSPSEKILEVLTTVYGLMRKVFDDPLMSYRKELIHSYSRIIMMQLADTVRDEREKFKAEPGNNRQRRETVLYHDFTRRVKEEFKKYRSVGHYADKMCVSPEHLSRIVKSVSGKSAGEWIRDYVVLEAKVMLRATDMTIYQISDALNFPNPSFFTKFFRKNTGITPGTYRETITYD